MKHLSKLLEELEYSNRKDELARLRLARKDEKLMKQMRDEINKAKGSK